MPALLLDAMRRLNDTLIGRVRPALREDLRVEERIDRAIQVLWRTFTSREFKAVVEIWVAQSHDPDQERMLLLLKRVVQREVDFMRGVSAQGA